MEFLGSWDWRPIVLSTIIGAIIGGFISQIISWVVWWITKPRLRFKTGSKVPFVIVVAERVTEAFEAGPIKREARYELITWIRVRVHNKGWRNAESCRVYLTDIFREDATEPILEKDVMILGASSGGDGDAYGPLSISRGFDRFFDIAFIPDRQELTVVSREFSARTKGKTLPPGSYEFWIAASGTNFNPVRRGVRVQFDGASAPIVSSFRLGGVFSICRAIRSAIRKFNPAAGLRP
jgi:hypothetical protein